MRIIGLTGSIACGKSTISSYLSGLGYPIVDGDQISRELTVPGSPCIEEIRQVFGERFVNANGALNRRALGQLIFHNDAARQRLDQLMEPYLQSATVDKIRYHRAGGAKLCFLDMPLLFEKGYDRLCDTVWCVWLPQELQLARLMERDGFSREDAMSRIRAVMTSDEKASRSGKVIDNSGTVKETLRKVDELLAEESRDPGAPSGERSPAPSRSLSPQILRSIAGFSDAPVQRTVAPKRVPVRPEAQSTLTPAQAGDRRKAFPVAPSAPESMDRPPAAHKGKQKRNAAWILPVWLRTTLIVLSFLTLILITCQSLMSAYLHRQEEKHRSEQAAIDAAYPLAYRDLIEKYAMLYNLEPSYIAAIILNESSFRPDAVSSVGARGLMQLMPDTAEWIAEKLKINGYSFERMYDPESNIRFGCWYLNYLSSLFAGNPVCVTSAYHAGQGQVAAWLSSPSVSSDGKTIELDHLPDGPTKTYAGRVTRDYGIYQEKYFTPADADTDSGVDPAASL